MSVQQLGVAPRHVTTEQGHHHQAPGDHGIDGDRRWSRSAVWNARCSTRHPDSGLRCASAAGSLTAVSVPTSRLVSRNHSTAGSAVSRHGPLTAPPVRRRRWSAATTWRWRTAARATRPMRAGRACLPLDLRAQAVELDLTCPSAAPARMAANSFGAPLARQRSLAPALPPGSDGAARRTPRSNPPPGPSAEHSGLAAQRRRRPVDVAQAVDPAPRLGGRLLRRRRRRLVRRARRAARRRLAQRQTRAIDRQGQMQMQAERLRGPGCAR